METAIDRGIDPQQLVQEFRRIVIKECGCLTDNGASYSFSQHPQPCTVEELDSVLNAFTAKIVEHQFRAQRLGPVSQADAGPIAQGDGQP